MANIILYNFKLWNILRRNRLNGKIKYISVPKSHKHWRPKIPLHEYTLGIQVTIRNVQKLSRQKIETYSLGGLEFY